MPIYFAKAQLCQFCLSPDVTYTLQKGWSCNKCGKVCNEEPCDPGLIPEAVGHAIMGHALYGMLNDKLDIEQLTVKLYDITHLNGNWEYCSEKTKQITRNWAILLKAWLLEQPKRADEGE